MMKKLIFISLMLIVAIGLNAQTYSVTKSMPRSDNKIYYGSVAGDTVHSTEGETWDFYIGKDYLYYYNITVDLDTLYVSGNNPNATVYLYGSDDDVTYIQIGETQTTAGSADTSFRFTNLSAASVVTNASHTEVTATATDYTRGFLDSVVNDDYLYDDTTVVAQRTTTVAAQTLTTAEGAVMWDFLRVKIVAADSTGRYDLGHITIICDAKKD